MARFLVHYLLLVLRIATFSIGKIVPDPNEPNPQGVTTLEIIRQGITELGLFSNYTALSVLDLMFNEINRVPASAFVNTPLALIKLAVNKLPYVPDCTGVHRTLQQLYIPHNYITECPTDIEYEEIFPFLTRMDLNYNYLTTIPSIVYAATNLEQLKLKGNRITSIPRQIEMHLSVIYLDLFRRQPVVLWV